MKNTRFRSRAFNGQKAVDKLAQNLKRQSIQIMTMITTTTIIIMMTPDSATVGSGDDDDGGDDEDTCC